MTSLGGKLVNNLRHAVELVSRQFFQLGNAPYIRSHHAKLGFGGGSNSMVESQPSKLLVAGSIPVSRSKNSRLFGWFPIAATGEPRFALPCNRKSNDPGALKCDPVCFPAYRPRPVSWRRPPEFLCWCNLSRTTP